MSGPHRVPVADVEIVTHGHVTGYLAEYARQKILEVCKHTREPVLHVRVKLGVSGDPAVPRPARAQANLDVNGGLLRSGVTAPTLREAVDLLQDRLRHRLARMAQHWTARRGGVPAPGPHEWRHVSDQPYRSSAAVEEPQLVRHKTYEPARATPDEAVFDMEHLDYDVHLFTDEHTGQDAVVYRTGPTGYRLARLRPAQGPEPPAAVPLTVSEKPAPRLTPAEAVERLNLAGWPFLFFADATDGRGRLLYHRHDGHYGLVTPAG
ncbi:HPF/RaiA family ribosome-associated protein [Actinoplanes sp. KI2]|uniref:HPF/RaiA family ribosome-associated protein n=1 Tax=Actinoplanes sp. KI2 TaxID=2983315 RepID=UPI0021D5B7F6|nr:HPF/RaiA family ribosome-associated protein [Actinoplanes sp. KI2]MCU7729448.1 HPF/RaiA family ribosome-associated protein [Actinoplanes sp. KI2]